MVRAHATAKYVRTSAQKAGLVLDLIRGKDVNRALSALQFSKKSVARDIAKVLRSAVANAQQREGFGGDVERLFISKCHADNGPSMKRVRPAPMGRAFRVVKRTTHLTVEVTERPQIVVAVPAVTPGTRSAKGTTPSDSTTGAAATPAKPARGAKAKTTTKKKTSGGGAKKKTAKRAKKATK
jgi:large subunit ribosomal protein L22